MWISNNNLNKIIDHWERVVILNIFCDNQQTKPQKTALCL